MSIQELSLSIRRNKVLYYIKNFARRVIPTWLYEKSLNNKIASIDKYDVDYITDRVNYYNKLSMLTKPDEHYISIKNIHKIKSPKAYPFDTFEYTRYFNQNLKANFLFGDITTVANAPTIQKSRPISDLNKNAVLLNLDKKRHFLFIKDQKTFREKKDMLIGRATIRQPHRIRFMEKYFNHPMCDLGQVNHRGGRPEWLKQRMSLFQHLDYKFILSLEGHDVATNLKWIMSSNSIAVMPKPKYETWFMEGRLIADFHYILIEEDYSDLEEKLQYYTTHLEEAEAIIRNANEYIKQFFNPKQEDLISLLVLRKYFEYTSQLQS